VRSSSPVIEGDGKDGADVRGKGGERKTDFQSRKKKGRGGQGSPPRCRARGKKTSGGRGRPHGEGGEERRGNLYCRVKKGRGRKENIGLAKEGKGVGSERKGRGGVFF